MVIRQLQKGVTLRREKLERKGGNNAIRETQN